MFVPVSLKVPYFMREKMFFSRFCVLVGSGSELFHFWSATTLDYWIKFFQDEHPQSDAGHERGQPGRSALGRLAGVLLLTRPQQEERQEGFMQHWAQFITQWTWRLKQVCALCPINTWFTILFVCVKQMFFSSKTLLLHLLCLAYQKYHIF